MHNVHPCTLYILVHCTYLYTVHPWTLYIILHIGHFKSLYTDWTSLYTVHHCTLHIIVHCTLYIIVHSLQTFSLRQTDGEHIKSRIIYPTSSPSAHKVGKNVSWAVHHCTLHIIVHFTSLYTVHYCTLHIIINCTV